MSTVGELVCAAAGRMPKPNITLRQIQEAAHFFRSLGIWDAEVLEGDAYDDGHKTTLIFPRQIPGMVESNSRKFRVIVLPSEEAKP